MQVKMMNEEAFAKLVKELDALGELVRTRQDEKQAVIDQFDKERGRYSKGRISEDTLISSVRKTNKELIKLDRERNVSIEKARKLADRISQFLFRQTPRVLRAKEVGVFTKAKRKPVKKKVAKKKVRRISVKKSKLTKAEIRREMRAEKALIR